MFAIDVTERRFSLVLRDSKKKSTLKMSPNISFHAMAVDTDYQQVLYTYMQDVKFNH